MADSSTTNLTLVLPEVGASEDTWGTKCNSNFIDLDAFWDANGGGKFAADGFEYGTARQLLQTNAGATAAEWSSNIDIPGTLDVAGAVTFDTTLAVTGVATFTTFLEGTTGNGYLALRGDSGATVNLRYTDAGLLLLGDTANANMTVGLTINGGANDNQHFALKNSDIATGLTSTPGLAVETDDFFVIGKESAGAGGVRLQALCEDAAQATSFGLYAWGGTADTAKTTAARGLFEFRAFEHDGANAVANITADGNVLSVLARVGGSTVSRFLIDEDGDLYSVTAAQTFDEHDDLALLDRYDIVRRDDLRQAHAEWAQEYEAELIELGVLGAPVSEGGMTNITQLQRLMVGALRQVATRLEVAESKLQLLGAG